jgi:hypothetical protein
LRLRHRRSQNRGCIDAHHPNCYTQQSPRSQLLRVRLLVLVRGLGLVTKLKFSVSVKQAAVLPVSRFVWLKLRFMGLTDKQLVYLSPVLI